MFLTSLIQLKDREGTKVRFQKGRLEGLAITKRKPFVTIEAHDLSDRKCRIGIRGIEQDLSFIDRSKACN